MNSGRAVAVLALWRDTIVFFAGLGFAFHEIVLREGPERWGAIVLSGTMMGLPAMLHRDERAAAPTPPSPPPPASSGPRPNGGAVHP